MPPEDSNSFSDDSQYISENPEAVEAYNSIKEILTMEKPFQKIAELPTCVQYWRTSMPNF
jgi:hypothetical protein